jgi:hypothetical protein
VKCGTPARGRASSEARDAGAAYFHAVNTSTLMIVLVAVLFFLFPTSSCSRPRPAAPTPDDAALNPGYTSLTDPVV